MAAADALFTPLLIIAFRRASEASRPGVEQQSSSPAPVFPLSLPPFLLPSSPYSTLCVCVYIYIDIYYIRSRIIYSFHDVCFAYSLFLSSLARLCTGVLCARLFPASQMKFNLVLLLLLLFSFPLSGPLLLLFPFYTSTISLYIYIYIRRMFYSSVSCAGLSNRIRLMD